MGSVRVHAHEDGLTRLTKRKGHVAVYGNAPVNAVPFFEFVAASKTGTLSNGYQDVVRCAHSNEGISSRFQRVRDRYRLFVIWDLR